MKYLILILPFLLCFSCAQNTDQNNEMKVQDSMIEDNLSGEADAISSEQGLDVFKFKAYEQRAIQKLEDFASYIEIISNSEYEVEFRDQARDMAMGLFINGQITDQSITQTKEAYPINDFLSQLSNNNFGTVQPKLKRFKVIEPFAANEKGQLVAKVSFIQKTNQINSKKTATLELAEVSKDFGDQQEIILERIYTFY